MADRLSEIQRRAESYRQIPSWQSRDDVDWLIAEVERLRDIETAAMEYMRRLDAEVWIPGEVITGNADDVLPQLRTALAVPPTTEGQT